jgi:hypothetical protein
LWGVYVTLVEDLIYRHDQEFGEKWASPRTSPNTASVTVRLGRGLLFDFVKDRVIVYIIRERRAS